MLEWLGHAETVRGARMIEAAIERLCADAAFATRDLGGSMTTSECGRRVVESLE